ncbi:hypothetical protein EON80_02645 [bacterium]|nr:MAG: hypothetical protein EON80_02645 [bacterium]
MNPKSSQPVPLPTSPETSCSVEGGCPPSHRAARRISTFIIAFLLLSLFGCGAYVLWSSSL